jgi:hypothetical protein
MPTPVSAEATRRARIMAVIQVTTGNFLEMYDFLVFGYYAAAIGRTFFPKTSEFASLMLSFVTFGVGFLIRPFGAVILGAYVDRRGLPDSATAYCRANPRHRGRRRHGAVTLYTARIESRFYAYPKICIEPSLNRSANSVTMSSMRRIHPRRGLERATVGHLEVARQDNQQNPHPSRSRLWHVGPAC